MPAVSGASLKNWRQWAIEQANTADVDPYEVDWLLQGVSDLSAAALRLGTYPPKVLLRFSLDALTKKWQRRLIDRVPVQYLVGETPWRDLMLTVTPAVLIPRPETELVIDIVQRRIQQSPHRQELETGIWVDMGTGSGAIAISLARALPQATILATDTSSDALAVAQRNAQLNNASHIRFYQGTWFEPLSDYRGGLMGMVANPPYIPSKTVQTLEPEVQHEPHSALDGGEDGLTDIRQLVEAAPAYLKPGGLWLTELMLGQADRVEALLAAAGYSQIEQHTDLSGVQRFVSACQAATSRPETSRPE
ncbi:MAG: peptide chain release factor N(5)-glutamine methyltransferase [Cyanobacteria bacterium J06627_15]